MKSLTEQLTNIWESPNTPVLDTANRKYAIVSDLHLGNKSRADDFRRNESTLVRALQAYHSEGYGLILLGDIEELWQFDLPEIVSKYDSSVYQAIRDFGPNNIWRVFGNHDIDWSTSNVDPIWPMARHAVYEALKLNDIGGQESILLIHGHQATKDSDKSSWYSRPLVRAYRHVENVGIHIADPTPSDPKSVVTKDYEKKRYDWASKEKRIIICGHSHRAIFASMSRAKQIEKKIMELEGAIIVETSAARRRNHIKTISKLVNDLQDERQKGRDITAMYSSPLPCYFNTGCCLYETGITLIEIEHDSMRLVKWENSGNRGKTVYDDGSISSFLTQLGTSAPTNGRIAVTGARQPAPRSQPRTSVPASAP